MDTRLSKTISLIGDNNWHLYHLPGDPGETKDLAAEKPILFQKMLSEYLDYAADGRCDPDA